MLISMDSQEDTVVGQLLPLTLRRQSPKSTGWAGWVVTEQEAHWPVAETALIAVDVWDNHWSRGAAERVNALVPRIDATIRAARDLGVLIIHAPSDVVAFYGGHPARERALAVPRLDLPELAPQDDPPLPIDDTDGGSDTGEPSWYHAWTRQHPAVEISDRDMISADGAEVYSILRANDVRHVLVCGVHTNMCILNRPFAIKRLVRWGFDVALVRDLTDAMYNPARPPYVSHEEGTRLVVEYIEKFWCPTVTSDQVLAAVRRGAGASGR
jgi:nicotinamidase-related amidase